MKVLISGSSSGIGLATAKKFLNMGYTVYGIDRKPSSIEDKKYIHYQKDIRDEDLPSFDSLDVIIANAGVQDEKEAIDVNTNGSIHFVNKYLNVKDLKSILFVISSSARNGAEFPMYSASKGGLLSYSKHLANSLASRGILVNSISPGGVITPLNKHILENKKLYEEVKSETLLHKWASAEEIAEWIYFITVINKSMTGEDILIDNGEMLKSNFIW